MQERNECFSVDDVKQRRVVVVGGGAAGMLAAWAAVADRLRRAAVTQSASVMDAGKK
jgi:NADPH-dependent 2,4-dienoyl-CoA reductase/sulfur reductase-like enzyme